jgi:MFS family permease
MPTVADSSHSSAAVTSPVLNTAQARPLSMTGVMRFPMMRHLWFAQVISVFGDFLALYAVITFLTFKLHADAQAITGVQIAYLLPIAILGALAGVFVDRWPLKLTMVSSDLARAGLVLLLLIATETWHFYVVLAIISIVSSFFGPAQGVAIRYAVPLNGLRSANAMMQQVTFGMRIIGPAIAVALVEAYGAASCYVLDSISFVGSACLIGTVAFTAVVATPRVSSSGPPVAPVREGAGVQRVWTDMKEGFRFIVQSSQLLFVVVALSAGMFVIGCFAPLTALYVRDDLHASTQIFGIASAFVGIGMVVGINLLSVFAKNAKSSVLIYSGLAGIAVGLSLMAGVAQVWTTLIAEFLIGAAFGAIFVPSETTIQMRTPPELLGRVGSTSMSIIFAAQIVGLVLSGILAQHIGARYVFAMCAVALVVLIFGGLVWMRPRLIATSD